MTAFTARSLRPVVGDLRQVASVRRIVLDDGAERGVRALVFSTGGGLDFWVMADRSLDIGLLSWRGQQLGWQSPAGLRAPALMSADGDAGMGFGRGFGGFLVTCGLDHIRQPQDGRPLHGRLPHTPARLLSYGEDWSAQEPVLYCEGEVIQWRYGGEAFRLRRRIEAPIGGSGLTILDAIENIGPAPEPLSLLYHFNLGYPAVATGTVVRQEDRAILGPLTMPDEGTPPPAMLHRSPDRGMTHCVVETPVDTGMRRVCFRYDAGALPYLQLWRDLRPNCGVLSIEPCNIGRLDNGLNEPGSLLAPGDTLSFRVEVWVEDLAATSETA
ncbi:DUF4432 family protein [Labrys neptuniae]